jgi:hypothetical protein
MKLESLSIQNHSWEKPAPYRGSLKFSNDTGEVTLKLSDSTSRKILAVVAEEIVNSAKDLADTLYREAAASSGLLIEAKPLTPEAPL